MLIKVFQPHLQMNKLALKVIVLLTLCFGLNTGTFAQRSDCREIDNLKVVTEVERDQNGQSTVKLKFDESALGNYAIWVIAPDHDQKIYKNGIKTFQHLTEGDYEFIIVARNGCSKKIEVKVK